MALDKAVANDYRDRLWRITPRPQLFPFSRLAITLILAGAQFGFSTLRHRWNPKLPTSQVGRDVVIFIAVAVSVYLVIYALEWLWNYVVVSPQLLDERNLAQIAEQANEIARLSCSKTQRETFASLMNVGLFLTEAFTRATDADEFKKYIPDFLEWVDNTITALTEAGLDTEAVAFSQVSSVAPSSEQKAAFDDLESWKRHHLARLAASRAKLSEIVTRRNL